MKQSGKFQSHQWREFRRLQHDGISGRQRRQSFCRRNRKGIIPGRDDADHAVRLAHQAAGLQFGDKISVGQRFVAEEGVGMVDEEAGGVEHNEHFSDQRFDQRLPGFAGDRGGDL